jgi:hypothetical protein
VPRSAYVAHGGRTNFDAVAFLDAIGLMASQDGGGGWFRPALANRVLTPFHPDWSLLNLRLPPRTLLLSLSEECWLH